MAIDQGTGHGTDDADAEDPAPEVADKGGDHETDTSSREGAPGGEHPIRFGFGGVGGAGDGFIGRNRRHDG